ncbi:hypothetical protein [Halobaculum magnesiiphilum]|uniref:DUF7979 domain-containing protein n=1 Tax=Halobaculum magnesiiphilum TaxID=1017351 RepID=A0A8T8WAB3_9EURY|nr:hypothetical protein [Halobaculum magnesiiphilum]QZP36780.1 hypothetical protein K6T50_10750 [Halobaculum magnesiiphilum]
MVSTRRRSLLATLGAAAAAGCLGDAPTDSPGGSATDAADATESDPNADPEGGAPDGDTLRLANADDLPTDSPVSVHPRPLAEFLERGAATDGPVRATGATVLTGKPPFLPGERTVRLVGDEVDDGAYALDIDGGLLYEWLLGATAVEDPPADADIVAVDDLSDERRSLAVEAIEGGRATVEPHTPLGTWARTEFVGGYVRYDGTVYRGRERQQTDAAFFSTTVWYVGTVTPTEEAAADGSATDAPTLHLDPLPSAAARVVDDLLGDWASNLDPVEADISDLDDPARRALAETDFLLTHVTPFEVSIS